MSDNPASTSPQPATTGETPPQQGNAPSAGTITPEMVSAIADKVYHMLLLELKYGRERHQLLSPRPISSKGGR